MALDLPTWNYALLPALVAGLLGALAGVVALVLPSRWRVVPAVAAVLLAFVPASIGAESVAATLGLASSAPMPVGGWLRELHLHTGEMQALSLAKIHWAAHVWARVPLVLAAIPFGLGVAALLRSRRAWRGWKMAGWLLPALPAALCIAVLAAAVARPVLTQTPPPGDAVWDLRLAEESATAPFAGTHAPMQTLEVRCRRFAQRMADETTALTLRARVGEGRVEAVGEGCRPARLLEIFEARLDREGDETGDVCAALERLADHAPDARICEALRDRCPAIPPFACQ